MDGSLITCFIEGLSNHSFQIFTEHLLYARPPGAYIQEDRQINMLHNKLKDYKCSEGNNQCMKAGQEYLVGEEG